MSFQSRTLMVAIVVACSLGTAARAEPQRSADDTFGDDVAFLAEHTELVILRSEDGERQLAIAPEYQGRVMTSTAERDGGRGFGWINYERIRSGEYTPHINHFGGEERFWLGPDGGQFTFFYAKGVDFTPENWQVPPAIDIEPYSVVDRAANRVAMRHRSRVTNYSDETLGFQIDREITLVERVDAEASLGVPFEGLRFVGYRSRNRLTNTGPAAWTEATGMPSIWLLGMYPAGPEATVVVPYREGDADALGPIVNDRYLGKVPADRLKVADGAIFFSGDGRLVSKIGVSPTRSLGVCGSYDARSAALTIVKYDPPDKPTTRYVNSMLEIQEEPFAGDAIHSYNNGPAEPPMPFYELETSSPALALKPGETGEHRQETYHFRGSTEALDRVAEKVLGVTLAEIDAAL